MDRQHPPAEAGRLAFEPGAGILELGAEAVRGLLLDGHDLPVGTAKIRWKRSAASRVVAR